MSKKLFWLLIVLFLAGLVIFAALKYPYLSSKAEYAQVDFAWSALSANTTQGGSVSINCTIFNQSFNQSIKTGMGIQLWNVNNEFYLDKTGSWNKIFNQTFNPCPIFLNPREQKTTILTIVIAEDAPIGNYTFGLQGIKNELHLTVVPKFVSQL